MPGGVHPLIKGWRRAGSWRWLALPLMVPALSLAQQATPAETVTGATPAAPVPLQGAPAASFAGAGLPGAVTPSAGLLGAGVTGLTLPPAEYTEYGASLGVGETDNVNLASSHPKAQTLTAANLFFDLIRTGTRLELSALGNFSDIDYLENAYSNQLLGRFDGLANLTLWSNHLTWLVRDDYGDQQIDPLESLNPVNLQRVNVFSTGPNLTLEPTLTSFVKLQALYSRTDYQTSPFNGQSGTGSVTIGHRFSALSSISLVGEVEQLRFDNQILNPDYQRREYYGDYSLRGARTAIDLQAGAAQANDVGTWKSSPLLRVSLTRDVSPFSTVTLAGGRDYTDATGTFSSLTSGAAGGLPINPATQTTGNALHTYGNAGWDFSRLRTGIGLTGGWERDEYDRQSIYDVTRGDLELSLNRQLTPALSAAVTADAIREQYSNQGFSDDYGTVGAGLVYRPGAWMVIYGRYEHEFRRTMGAAAQGFGYDEDRVFIMIGYYPHARSTAAPGAGVGAEGAMQPGVLP
jgi:hypothetical protein